MVWSRDGGAVVVEGHGILRGGGCGALELMLGGGGALAPLENFDLSQKVPSGCKGERLRDCK